MGNLMNNVMIKINRFYFYHFKISEKWGGLHPESDAFALLCIEIWGIIWAILFFVNPLGAIVEAGLSCVLSLILGYFLFKKDEKYEKIISNQKDITVLERVYFFIIRIALYLLFYKVALSSLNR